MTIPTLMATWYYLLRVSMATWTERPIRSLWSGSEPESILILTGSRWTTLTQFPVAFSGGRREKAAPVPALKLSTFPA